MFSDEIKTFRCDHNSWRWERCVGGEERRGGRGGECGCEVVIQLCGRRGEERGKGRGVWVGREGEGSEQYNLRALTFM